LFLKKREKRRGRESAATIDEVIAHRKLISQKRLASDVYARTSCELRIKREGIADFRKSRPGSNKRLNSRSRGEGEGLDLKTGGEH